MIPRANASSEQERAGREAMREALLGGAYGPGFDHAGALKEFVSVTLPPIVRRFPADRPVRILECGCGTGVWLSHLAASVGAGAAVRWYGFDLTPEMIARARRRLASDLPGALLQVGSVLDPAAYRFDDGADAFDLIFAYDLVQQLPRALQFPACRAMLGALAAGGALVVFDHERFSRHGIGMGVRKWVTRWLRIPWVPRYYCVARYPSLRAIAAGLRADGRTTEVVRAPRGLRKRALVVR